MIKSKTWSLVGALVGALVGGLEPLVGALVLLVGGPSAPSGPPGGPVCVFICWVVITLYDVCMKRQCQWMATVNFIRIKSPRVAPVALVPADYICD